MSVKLLTQHNLEFLSLKVGCTGLSESTLVKMPHCWKSRCGSYVVGSHWKCLFVRFLRSTTTKCFYRDVRKKFSEKKAMKIES